MRPFPSLPVLVAPLVALALVSGCAFERTGVIQEKLYEAESVRQAVQGHPRAAEVGDQLNASQAHQRQAEMIRRQIGDEWPGQWSRIEALENPAPAAVWRTWCLRAIPVSLFLIGLFIGGLLFLPAGADSLSQSEALLLRNAQPVPETNVYLEEAKGLDRNMAIIFAASDRTPDRRPRP